MNVDKGIDKSENKLVKGLSCGDERAFGIIFDNYSKKVFALARKFDLSHVDAEGIVQEVFLKIWERREYLNPELSINAYIFKVSKSIIIRRKKRILLEVAYQRRVALTTKVRIEPSGEGNVIFEDLLEKAGKLIDKLPKNQKRAFVMKNFDHRSVEEIAAMLEVPKRKVENQIARANKSLREKLSSKKWGIISISLFIVNYLFC
jgi:RNA polymerase sigma factor (sigma-70 family)